VSGPRNLGMLLDRSGDPDRALFIEPGDGGARTITLADFDARCDAIARGLLARGLSRGDRVAILSANRADYVAAFMGAMRAGVVPAPVNHKLPPAKATEVVAGSGARLVLHDAARADHLDRAALPDVAHVGFDDDGPGGFEALLDPGAFDAIDPRDDEAAFMMFTSGSTGRPKGVLLSHESHRWTAEVRLLQTPMKGERVLVAAPLYHMNALALSILICAGGADCVLLPQFEAAAFIEAIDRFDVTWLTAVPPMIAMMMQEDAALARADLTSVRTVRMGSAPVNDALVGQIKGLWPNARIINAYGTTEGGPLVFDAHPDGLPQPTGSVGVPHAQVAVRLTGPGAPDRGVLEMRSPAVMMGYHNRPDVASPITEDGFYRTGDVFRRDENGFHFFVGRDDDMFISGAENIFPGEVEQVIESHPDVMQACVVPVDDAVKGTKPVAFVVLRAGAGLDEAGIKAYVLANAPAYQHPRRVWFMDKLPLAATNKIDRNALRAQAEAEVNGAA
jgi:long-chain acyl-CoA synthetase